MKVLDLFKRKQMVVDPSEEMLKNLTTLQNEVGVAFNTKVIAITSISNDDLSAQFAKAYAEAYSLNGCTSLIVDANLYNPCLLNVINKGESDVDLKDNQLGKDYRNLQIDDKTNAICLNKEIYPSEVYKTGVVQKLIKENFDKYDHFIVLVPSIKEHKEVFLLKDIINAILLVTQKNITTKKHIFEALEFFRCNELPIAQTIVLK